jgi:signal transduction histidine kinase
LWGFNVSLGDNARTVAGTSRLRLLNWVNILGAPFLIVGFVLVEASTGANLERVLSLLLVGVLGSVVLAVFLLLAGWALRHVTWGESWTSIVILLLLGSLPRTLTLEGGLAFFGITDEVSLATRILNSLILIPVTLGLSLRALEFVQRYRERRNHLVGLLLRGEQQLSRQVLPLTTAERSLVVSAERDVSAVNEGLVQALVATKERLRGGDVSESSLGELRDQADQQWRKISHRLWEESAGQIPRMSPGEFVNTVALLRPLSLGYLALGSFFLFVLALIRLFPVGEAVLWSVGWYVLMALASLALNEIPRRLPRPGLTLALLLVPYVFGGAIFLVAPGVPPGQGWGAAGIHLTVALSMVVIGAGPAVSQSQDTVLVALRRLLETQSLQRIHIESESSILAQKFAERLHSDIRGSFHARMMRLQKQIDEGALADAEKEIDALVEALREDQPPLDSLATLDDLLDFLSHWDGIITITHSIVKNAIPARLVDPVTTIVMNAVNDAVRHGGAENIGVSFEVVGDRAVLCVTNDGADAPSSGPEGLGHASLDRLAGAGWERTRRDGVTELTVDFSAPS